MNLKEQHIIDSLIKETLDAEELSALKSNLVNENNYENFLNKLLSIIINKDLTVSLIDFLKFNNLSNKVLFFQNKATDVIEELAELSFKGHESENTIYLEQSNNEVFQDHIQFLKETQNAIIFSERIALKKKLEKLDDLNAFDFDEKDIKAAITLHERQKLKKHLSELSKKGKGGSAGGTIIKLDFRQALKYAAILILVIGPTLFIINKINKQSATTNDLATKETKKQLEPVKIEKEPYNFQLPNADSYAMEKELLQEQKFGFTSSSTSKNINIKIYNLSGQLHALQNEIDKHNGDISIKNYLMNKVDSINAVKETYIFDKKNGLVIYSVKLSPTKNLVQQLKLIAIENDKLYLKEKSTYYLINRDGLKHKLIKETSEDIIDQLDLIENQNE
jgi:hypothetical protein